MQSAKWKFCGREIGLEFIYLSFTDSEECKGKEVYLLLESAFGIVGFSTAETLNIFQFEIKPEQLKLSKKQSSILNLSQLFFI